MERQNSWKRTEEIEIDLADLLRKLCLQWKQIAACMLVFAVILGVYGWKKARDISETEVIKTEEMTESEAQAVSDAVCLKEEIDGQAAYLEHSVLMQTDPYHKSKCIMLYAIDHAERKELPKIAESYLNFVMNGGAADILAESKSSWNMEKIYIAELISAYQKTYSSPYQIVVDSVTDSGIWSEALFYIEITGKDVQTAKTMALDMQDVLEKYSAQIKRSAGSHRLELVSSVESVTSDSGLQTQQRDKKASLSANRTSLKNMTDAFNAVQLAAYQKAAGVKEAGWQEETESDAEEEQMEVSQVKYTVLGAAGGIFVYCCMFICCYIFRDTVKSTEEMRRMYTFPVYGRILLKRSTGKNRKMLSDIQTDAFGCTKAQVFHRVRFACQKQCVTRLCAASGFPLTVLERECLDSMAQQLRKYGIELIIAESVSANTGLWEHLAEIGNVLMICRLGTTTRRMIDDAMYFYVENKIAVIGAAVFSKKDKKIKPDMAVRV